MVIRDKYSQEIIEEIQFEDWLSISEKMDNCYSFQKEYRNSDFVTRRKYLMVILDELEQNQNVYASLISKEAGKPLFYAKGELGRCIKTVELGLKYFELLQETNLSLDLSNTKHSSAMTKRFPVGVIFGIAPFNFPLNLALHKIIPAIVTGNTILIKPSPYTPLSLQKLIRCTSKSLPKGLLEFVFCDNEIAEKICTHDKIKMISFTGSPAIGWHIKSLVPKKKIALELGGNAAVYIHESCKNQLREIAKKVAIGCFLFSGQICISTQRIIVDKDIYEDFKQQLIEVTEKLHIGDPFKDNIIGPLIDKIHLTRIQNAVSDAKNKGAKILLGGNSLSKEHNLFSPTLMENVADSSKIWSEEIFGPVACLKSCENFQDAVQIINNSKYGLQAGIYTQDSKVKKYCFNEIDTGGIIINNIPGFRVDEMPYGGIKESGYGREGIRYAMEEMTELKLLIE